MKSPRRKRAKYYLFEKSHPSSKGSYTVPATEFLLATALRAAICQYLPSFKVSLERKETLRNNLRKLMKEDIYDVAEDHVGGRY